ncbi:ASCH domain-containing protein [Coleofasciculus sp. FACHB-SPT36]|uniref:ASCH domain-containing protein n=1 Tax=Cyanophyceae TaxID=3028117 RepID=UPI00168C0CE4|nr:ASCH domain-containing protein [Coleofasciculus sp. FACHB-SPT36]MBD2537778.1 ASCH domain-containing protein [Coleofasciculus sp. FACHB-SPT36]
MQVNILLLSIRPEYANKIFDGTKKVELRRVRPRLSKGDLVIVYVSSPKKAVLGSFTVDKIIEEPILELWNQVWNKAGITLAEFDSYYEGASVGFGILLKKPNRFEIPVSLERLREKWIDFRPPQSYHYLTDSEYEIVKSLGQ